MLTYTRRYSKHFINIISIFTISLWASCYSHFTEEETEAWKGRIICPRSLATKRRSWGPTLTVWLYSLLLLTPLYSTGMALDPCHLCFPGGTVIKNLPANAGDMGSIPGSGKCPGEGNGNHSSMLAWEIPWTEATVHRVAKCWNDWAQILAYGLPHAPLSLLTLSPFFPLSYKSV